MSRTRRYPTVDDLTRVIDIRCGNCGAMGRLYPYPEGQGAMVCPNCSPVWLESFVTFASAELKKELTDRCNRPKTKKAAA